VSVPREKWVIHGPTLLSEDDLFLFNEGTHFRLWEKLGAHAMEAEGQLGWLFAVWAPSAESVHVMGDFNGWDRDTLPLRPRGSSGIWEGFVPNVQIGQTYKYVVQGRNGARVEKADPFAFRAELPPSTGSVTWELGRHAWRDDEWMRTRGRRNALDAPMSVYEVHLGSWRRVPEEGHRSLRYVEAGERLAEHCTKLGMTHVELLPLMEHPFYGSWGYQTTGFFAPTARYGRPEDLMSMVDTLHRSGIGVLLDWVPSHFPTDSHGLGWFDGTHLFEHADPRQGFHPDWGSYIFNYSRNEVRSFLVSSALYWLELYHADGLRCDAVASMLYLDYSRKAGEWIPNPQGGRENLAAIGLLRKLNEEAYRVHPDVQMVAEESTAWPGVSQPTSSGGLGFGLKWDMGWMHDTLLYMSREPVHRRWHQSELTFRGVYAFTENFMLPLSHDEVVHGKGSLLSKMPGDDWQKFANLRLLHAWMHAQPGKKLLFMGGEIAQRAEWSHEKSIDWHLLEWQPHAGMQRLVGDLNRLHREEPALHELDCDPSGFEWVDTSDADSSVLSFLRLSRDREPVLCVFNFTPIARPDYRVGVPQAGRWEELLNTDATDYGGSGVGNLGAREAHVAPFHGRPCSIELNLPPLGALLLRPARA
jgi:1,4-alpha-glucan branching enzyme